MLKVFLTASVITLRTDSLNAFWFCGFANSASTTLVYSGTWGRKELMIIYGEDLASTGFTAADLKKGGKAYDQWPAIERNLVERAESRIKIKQTDRNYSQGND